MNTYDTCKMVECPRCHEQCGWCADPRWMHGTLRLPNFSGRKSAYCTIPEMEPEGDNCPICGGDKLVVRTVTYAKAQVQP